jgi:hypothetical protein
MLKNCGVAADDLAVFSSEPLELPKDALARKSNMSLAVVSGAVTFGLCVIGFVYYAQTSYPIITGGMPIFSFWATGVVFYELTMLGAILMSLSWFLYESGLFTRNKAPVPVYAPGCICLRIHCPADREPEFCRLMEMSGGSNFKAEDEKR